MNYNSDIFNNTFFKNEKFETKINTICYSWSLSVYFYRLNAILQYIHVKMCIDLMQRELAFQKYMQVRYILKITNIASQNISSQNMFVMFFIFPTRMLFQKQISVWQCIIVLLLAIFVWSLFWKVLKNKLNWFHNSVFQFYSLRHGEFFNHIHFYLNYIMFKLKLAIRFWENNLV